MATQQETSYYKSHSTHHQFPKKFSSDGSREGSAGERGPEQDAEKRKRGSCDGEKEEFTIQGSEQKDTGEKAVQSVNGRRLGPHEPSPGMWAPPKGRTSPPAVNMQSMQEVFANNPAMMAAAAAAGWAPTSGLPIGQQQSQAAAAAAAAMSAAWGRSTGYWGGGWPPHAGLTPPNAAGASYQGSPSQQPTDYSFNPQQAAAAAYAQLATRSASKPPSFPGVPCCM